MSRKVKLTEEQEALYQKSLTSRIMNDAIEAGKETPPPTFKPLTGDQLTAAFLANPGTAIAGRVSDPRLIHKANEKMADPAFRERATAGLLYDQALREAAADDRREREEAAEAKEQARRKLNIESSQEMFRASPVGSLEESIAFLMARGVPCGFVLVDRDNPTLLHPIKQYDRGHPSRLVELASEKRGILMLDLSTSGFTAFVLSGDTGTANCARLFRRFKFLGTVAYATASGEIVHLYSGPVELADERIDREILEGIRLMSKGQIAVPQKWIITPAKMELSERQVGIPNVSADFLSTIRDLRNASQPVWVRCFKAMCENKEA